MSTFFAKDISKVRFSRMNQISLNVSQASVGMQEISENISQATAVNQEVTRNIVTVRSTADSITNSSLEVREYSHELNSLVNAMHGVINHIEIEPPLFDIGAVKTAHLNWKIQLEAVLEGRKAMQPDEVTGHHDCLLGKWYDTAQGDFTQNPIFKQIETPHKKVHDTAREIVSLYCQGKPEAAQRKLAQFEAARRELFGLLDNLYLI